MTENATLTESSNKSFYNADSASYDAQRWQSKGGALTDRSQQGILQRLCADWNGKRVVEVGPGTARFTIPLLKKNNRMTLVDISPAMLAAARANIETAGLAEQIDAYTESSVYALPFQDETFDHAISLNVFNHLERPGEALKELSRVIRPGATLLFNYANLESYYWPAALRINSRKKAIGQHVYSSWERPGKMRRIIQAAGLDLIRLVGHVHMPRAMERLPIGPVVSALDAISRAGPLRRLAPFHFCLCRKRPQ